VLRSHGLRVRAFLPGGCIRNAPCYYDRVQTGHCEYDTGIVSMSITEDADNNKRLKTSSSRRTVPVHPELVRLGFLKYIEMRRKHGASVPLFPLLKPRSKGSVGEAWSKWYGRYIRSIGITNRARVFHSFRHSFKDGLRAAAVSEDINDALNGHSGGGVGRTYGAKDNERRFGLKRLAEAVSSARFAGLSLPPPQPTQ
jgi:integrase